MGFVRILLIYGGVFWVGLSIALADGAQMDNALADNRPRRVVSINLCTDQLAMLLAGEGQLYSVSRLSLDPDMSYLAHEAQRRIINYGRAEEIYLMHPDLVLAGTFSSRKTVALLRQLGVRVELFEPAYSFEDIEKTITRLGRLLHRQEQAEHMIASMNTRLEQRPRRENREMAVFYQRGGYIAGTNTLAGQVIKQAGLDNLAEKLQLTDSVQLPLEILLLNKPDYIIRGALRYKAGLQEFREDTHPALQNLMRQTKRVTIPDALTMCGGPFTVDAVEMLRGAQGVRHD